MGNPAEETYRYPNQSFLFATLKAAPQMSIRNAPARPTKAAFRKFFILNDISFISRFQAGP